ncbi:MAG: hypothetical protein ABL986_11560 [Vicinamibacterales bacterium]
MAFEFTPTHLHLLLNHFPTIGFIIGLFLFVAALVAKSEHLKLGSMAVLVGISIITVPTYITGNAAGEVICIATNLPGPCPDGVTSRSLIEQHEGWALVSLGFMVITGGLAWLGIWQWRRYGAMSKLTQNLVLVLGFVTLGLVSRAAALGGEIRHPEIRVTADTATKQFGRIAGDFISNTPWTWIAAETLHFIGLTLLLGVLTLIFFKVLGYLPKVTYDALDRLLPWAILGYGLNTFTGMAFFAAAPYQYIHNVAFYYKLGFLIAAGLVTIFYTFDSSWAEEAEKAPGHAKFLAGAALFLWVGVMFWGSMLPFIGNAF